MVPHAAWIFSLILLLPGVSVSDKKVFFTVGDTLTLPCTYNVKGGRASMCWGRGECSLLTCNDIIIQTDGSKVTKRKSDRYQLRDIEQGDVSLTITDVTEEDGGKYCCRVEIVGAFNDQISTYKVTVRKRDKLDTEIGSTGRSIPPGTEADDQLFSDSVGTPMTPVKISPAPESEAQSGKMLLYILIPILVLIAITVTAVIIFKCKVKDKTPLMSVGPMTELAASGTNTEENIYLED